MRRTVHWTVIVAALGYFVDMFDLTVFGVVRTESLKSLGYSDPVQIVEKGIALLNWQAAGLLLGGLAWGIIGDKKGRLRVLFGSIALYSAANVLNAFVTSHLQYSALRFLAGLGLAGELGAAITIVAETMDRESRGFGTTIVATLGLLGAVAASLLGQILPWRGTYLLAGALGFCLLLSRMRLSDSSLFQKQKKENVGSQGDLFLLLSPHCLPRYLKCIAAGVPVYFITGILLTFSPEITLALGLHGVTAGNSLLFGSIGLAVGDLLSGLLSQFLRSRKKAIFASLALSLICCCGYFSSGSLSLPFFYTVAFFLGLSGGYWAVLVTVAAEQFGTNLRATAATSVPNFVRASVIPFSLAFHHLRAWQISYPMAALILGAIALPMAALSLWQLRETYGVDLDFQENSQSELDLAAVSQMAKANGLVREL